MMSHPRPVVLAALLALMGVSCARAQSRDLEVENTAASIVVAPPPSSLSDDEVEQAGSLVIRDDVVKRCPTLRKFARETADDVAIDAIRAVGECMTRGGLRSSRLVVRGGGKATRLFREAIGRFGVTDGRIEKIVDDSDVADRRVEVGLTKHAIPGAHDDVVLAVRKSQVVGFLISGTLDD